MKNNVVSQAIETCQAPVAGQVAIFGVEPGQSLPASFKKRAKAGTQEARGAADQDIHLVPSPYVLTWGLTGK
jgi:hypothetical protein